MSFSSISIRQLSNSGQPFFKYFWEIYFHISENITRFLGKKCRKRPPKLSLYCFKVARTSIFLGIPFTFGPLIHKQLVIYCKIIITRGLQIGLKFIMIPIFSRTEKISCDNSPNRFALLRFCSCNPFKLVSSFYERKKIII